MSILVYEDFGWRQLLPLVYFRSCFELRCGMGRLIDRMTAVVDQSDQSVEGVWCRPNIAEVTQDHVTYPINQPLTKPTLLLNGRGLWHRLPEFPELKCCWVGVCGPQEQVACVFLDDHSRLDLTPEIMLDQVRFQAATAGMPRFDVSACVSLVEFPWHLVNFNEQALCDDWQRVEPVNGSTSSQQRPGVHVLNEPAVHIGKDSRIKPCVVVDAEEGPVWIGDNVTIMPHSYVQGPAYIGDGTLLQPGATVHAGTTIGPRCKVGGEIEGSIIHGYSNKQHDGFLGHSYVASWVNIAADCINSDLKNTYGNIRVPINGREVDSKEMFVGMFVGDFSKAGINVSFPTGSVIGFCSSVFRSTSPKFVPSFAWINGDSMERFDVDRGTAVARKVMARRQHEMTLAEVELFARIRRQALAIELQPQLEIEAVEWE